MVRRKELGPRGEEEVLTIVCGDDGEKCFARTSPGIRRQTAHLALATTIKDYHPYYYTPHDDSTDDSTDDEGLYYLAAQIRGARARVEKTVT